MATTRQTTRGPTPTTSAPVSTASAVDTTAPIVSDGKALPEGFEDAPDGLSVIYTLQHDPEPLASGVADMMDAPFRIRLPKKVYARHIRIATTDGEGSNAAVGFHLLVAMARVPAEWIDRLDARDFAALTAMVGTISKNT